MLKYFYYEEPDSIQKLLVESGIPSVKVKFLKDDRSGPLYVVYFQPQQIEIHTLNTKFNKLNDVCVKWETFKKLKSKVTQCYNCKEYGHGATNCGKGYKCIRCTSYHPPDKCQYKDDKNHIPVCVNCSEEHAANSKTCKAYKDYIAKINRATSTQLQKHFSANLNESNNRPSQWTTSFSQENWNYNNLFPTLPTPPATSSSLVLQPKSSYRSLFSSLNDVTENRSDNNLLHGQKTSNEQLLSVIKEFRSISGIDETINLFKELTLKLKNTDCHKTRIAILLLEYTMP